MLFRSAISADASGDTAGHNLETAGLFACELAAECTFADDPHTVRIPGQGKQCVAELIRGGAGGVVSYAYYPGPVPCGVEHLYVLRDDGTVLHQERRSDACSYGLPPGSLPADPEPEICRLPAPGEVEAACAPSTPDWTADCAASLAQALVDCEAVDALSCDDVDAPHE